MKINALEYLSKNPVKPMVCWLIDKIMFNMKYSILDYGSVGSKVKEHLKKIMNDKRVPHFFAMPPSHFDFEGERF
jgi:hypothetical protein